MRTESSLLGHGRQTRILRKALIVTRTSGRLVSSLVKHIGVGGLGFDSQPRQIEHSVANGSPPLRRSCGAVLPRR